MSGGRFEYAQYKIADIYNEIEDYLEGHDLDECDVQSYIEDRWLDIEDIKYVRKHHHTVPNYQGFSEDTIKEFRKAVQLLKQAEVYANRIDWLLCGDDSEVTFRWRLKEDLKKLESDKQ